MNPDTAQAWRVIRITCLACQVIEAEQDNDAEAAREHGHARGRKYMVQRTA